MWHTFGAVGLADEGCTDVDGSDRIASTGFTNLWLRRTCVVKLGGFSFMVEAPGETLATCSTKLLKTCTATSFTPISCTCAGNVFRVTTLGSVNAICGFCAMIRQNSPLQNALNWGFEKTHTRCAWALRRLYSL